MAGAVVGLTLSASLVVASQMLPARAGSAGLVITSGTGGVVHVSDESLDLVFDPAQEGGISRVYDLATDPQRTVSLGPAPGYTVFNTYVYNTGWANIGRGSASVFEVSRGGSGSVVVHAVGSFMREDGSGAVPGLQHETWTTIYPGGHVFIRRHLVTGAGAVALSNFGGKAIDVSTASTWNAIFTGAAGDSSYPNGANTSAGNGGESWIGLWQGGSGPGQSLSVGMSSWQSQDFGFTYRTVRVLVGNASSRSHEAQRTESGVTLAANTTYSSQFSGWFSTGVRIASMNAQVLDYRSPALSVTNGALATTDTEPVAGTLTGGFNPSTGAYVVGSTATGATLQLQFPSGVTTRYRPAFKLTGWPGSLVQVQLAGTNLAFGTDYLADLDSASGTLRLVLLKDVVASSPLSGQLQSGDLAVTPSGSPLPSPSPSPSPNPSPSPSPSPTPSPSPSPTPSPPPAPPPTPGSLQTIVGPSTIEVNDGTTFAAIFDRTQEGGISRVYDLATDPRHTVNLGPAPGYTVFNTYVNNGSWADIGRGGASVFEVSRGGSGSVVIHAVGSFIREDGSAVPGLQHETWTTIYPGGHVFIRRHLVTGAGAVALSNFGGKAIDVSTASTWNAIFTGAAGDSSYPNGANTSAGNGGESWIGLWQGGSGPGQSLSVGMSSWQSQDFGFTYRTVRVLVGNASSRSHEAQRTESGVTLAANTTYSSQFSGWFSTGVRIASMNAQVLDYRSPALSVTNGALATTDTEPVAGTLTGGFNPSTGAYVVGSTATGATLQLQFPSGVTTRYRPAFKLTGWPGSLVQVQLAGTNLAFGTDYLADLDSASGTLRLVLLKDVVASSPLSGQLQSGDLAVTPSGSPLPSPSPSPSPIAAPTPGPLQTIVGPSTVEVNDGTTFAAIFDRNQGGGISRLYDLARDPIRAYNLGPQPGYTVFNSYLRDASPSATIWGIIGEGPATTFEVTNQSAESTTIHVVTPYYCEFVESPTGKCLLGDVTTESWTTLYPGGHVFFERRIITGANAHTLSNAAPASVDLCLCSSLNGIFDGVASDTSYPSPADARGGNGNERWWGQYQTPTGAGPNLGVLEMAYQDHSFGMTYFDMRLIVGSDYLRSHVTPRTENTVTLAANTTYVARYRGWISDFANSNNAYAMTADYRQPNLTVTTGSIQTSDAELGAIGLVTGYNAGTGRYVVAPSAAGQVQAQLGFPVGVTVRYRPSFKVVGWAGGPVVVRWGSTTLTSGVDYRSSVDSSGALRVSLEFDVVAGNPSAGQRQNAVLSISNS